MYTNQQINMEKKYDFEAIDGIVDDDETTLGKSDSPHPNFRIARSCANCKYWLQHKAGRRGYCRVDQDPKDYAVVRWRRESLNMDTIANTYFKAYATNLCDNHQYRSIKQNFQRLERWMHLKFDRKTGKARRKVI